MPQVVQGLQFAPRFGIYYGAVDPNGSSASTDAKSSALGSLYLRQDTGQFYVCTTAAIWDVSNTVLLQPATWTALNVP